MHATSSVSLSGAVRRISCTAVPVSSKSSSWMPGAGSGTWPRWTGLSPSSGLWSSLDLLKQEPRGSFTLAEFSAGPVFVVAVVGGSA